MRTKTGIDSKWVDNVKQISGKINVDRNKNTPRHRMNGSSYAVSVNDFFK